LKETENVIVIIASIRENYLSYVKTHLLMGGRRVVGTIWCVGAGDPSSRPARNANSGIP